MRPKILVGYDASSQSRDALVMAEGIAGLLGGTVMLARVEAWGPYDYAAPEMLQEIRAEGEKELTAAAAALRARGCAVEAAPVSFGSAPHGLHETAERESAGLIVVGSSHRGPIGRVLAGTVATRLLHGSPCPVAVASRGLASVGQWKPSVIGLAYDGSVEAQVALEEARTLATQAGARVRVLAVGPDVSVPNETIDQESFDTASREQAEAWLHEARGSLRGDVVVEGAVLHGEPTGMLEQASAKLDLLVLGSRGYGPLRRVLLGSVSSHVVTHAHCPVLVTPRGTSADPAPGAPANSETEVVA